MTAPLDLEALRAALDAINSGKDTCEGEGDRVTAERLDDAHETVELALAELTTRRARDAEVEGLVEALRYYADDANWKLNDGCLLNELNVLVGGYKPASTIAKQAIATFAGAKP